MIGCIRTLAVNHAHQTAADIEAQGGEVISISASYEWWFVSFRVPSEAGLREKIEACLEEDKGKRAWYDNVAFFRGRGEKYQR